MYLLSQILWWKLWDKQIYILLVSVFYESYCTECLCLEGGGGGSSGTTTTSGTTASGGCIQGWIADGYCDDINNNVACTYDGGDCCGSYVNIQFCTQCQCLEWRGES